MDKIKSTAKLSEWVAAVNELIQYNNESQALLLSFKNAKETFSLEVTGADLNNGKAIDILTTGLYRVTATTSNGTLVILVNDGKEVNNFRRDIKNNESVDLMLCHGDSLYIQGTGFLNSEKYEVTLIESVLQIFSKFVNREGDRIVELVDLKNELTEHINNLQRVILLEEEFNAGIRLMDGINTNMSALSSRVTDLENK